MQHKGGQASRPCDVWVEQLQGWLGQVCRAIPSCPTARLGPVRVDWVDGPRAVATAGQPADAPWRVRPQELADTVSAVAYVTLRLPALPADLAVVPQGDRCWLAPAHRPTCPQEPLDDLLAEAICDGPGLALIEALLSETGQRPVDQAQWQRLHKCVEMRRGMTYFADGAWILSAQLELEATR